LSLDLLSINNERTFLRNNKFFILQSVLLSLAAVLVFYVLNDTVPLFALAALALCISLVFSYYLSFTFFLILTLGPTMLFLHAAVLYTPFLLLSFLLNYNKYKWNMISIPILPYVLIYMISCIPSLFFTPEVLLSIRDSYNLFAFLMVIIITAITIDVPKKMMLIFYAFIAGMTIHSLIVIMQNLMSGKRSFGIMAVFYIDFAALAAIYSLILFFYYKGYIRIFLLAVFSINLFGLILTQTRNAWISFGFGAFTVMIYLFFKHRQFKLDRKLILSTLVIFTFLVGAVYITALVVSPQISERFDIAGKGVTSERLTDLFGNNSLASRGLIWYTAYNAFTVHPVFGIGVYAFKHTSGYYYTIPDDLFKYFVAGKTPHLTYIEVITETGVFGFIFFLVFLFSIIRFSMKCLKAEQTKEDGLRTLLIIWTFIYIIFSMFMTEAWLYGQFLMWFGIMIGMASRNYKLITEKDIKA